MADIAWQDLSLNPVEDPEKCDRDPEPEATTTTPPPGSQVSPPSRGDDDQ